MSPDFRDWRTDGPGGHPAWEPVSESHPSTPGLHGHTVRFYGNEASLSAAIAGFIAPALSARHAALVFAAPGLRRSLRDSLLAHGIDAETALADGRLHWHDARGTLDRILSPSGMPDEDKFMRVIGGLIARASAARPALRAFAGMSALPWASERPDAALELERLWGMLGRTVAFSLLCAYPLPSFRGRADTFAHVCDAHDWTIPREPFRSDAPEGERLRQIAQLQLRLAELEPDIEGSGWTIGDPRQGLPDALPVLIWSSGPDGRPTFVNRTWLEFTGNDEPHELGRGLQGVHPEDRAGVEAAYNRALEGRAPFRTEFRYRRRDGAWRWLLNTASPRLDAEGSFLGFSGACIDITDRKAAEEQASQARNLESLGRLAGGLAHDFNNLLTSINGYSEIGLSLVPEAGRLHDFLTEIRDAGERANELTRQLLAYGSKQVLSATVFDLNPTLDHMEPVLRRQLGDGIRLERVQQAGLGRIQADPGQTQQLILGLILNARDAMPEGGTLTLETEDVLAQGGPDGGPRPYVRLSVRDTGPGMDPETMSRVFEPFFTTKRAGAGGQGRMGAGLGLASAYGFARQSGGFLSVESEPGAGSVFRLHLPWIDPESGKTARSGPLPAGGASILIAAGSETLRRFLSHALYAEGYAVSEAPDVPTTGTGGDADPGPDLLIAEDPCGPIRAATLAARLKLRHPALRALSIAAAAEVSDLPLPPAGNALLPLTLPLTRGGLIAHARRALGDAGAEKIAPGSFPRSGPRAG